MSFSKVPILKPHHTKISNNTFSSINSPKPDKPPYPYPIKPPFLLTTYSLFTPSSATTTTMSAPTLLTPTTTTPKPRLPIRCKHTPSTPPTTTTHRRTFLSLPTVIALSSPLPALIPTPALAASDDEYTKETQEVINKVRNTINMDKTDPNIATAVAELRETSNSWVAKYRREKALLGRVSFRDIYSALNAVSGHYVNFGPTSPIPAKRKVRILEEMDSAEKALLRGR